MKRYEFFVTTHFLNGNVEIVRKGRIFQKVVARYRNNSEGFTLAYKHADHLNKWFSKSWWENTTWL